MTQLVHGPQYEQRAALHFGPGAMKLTQVLLVKAVLGTLKLSAPKPEHF